MVAFKLLLGIAVMVALTVGANLMLELGAMVAPAQRTLFGILSWQSVVGLALFGAAGIILCFRLARRAAPCRSGLHGVSICRRGYGRQLSAV
jgi:hypothetical protein